MIDGEGDIGIEVAERIVGQRSEMDDGVDPFQVLPGHVADILADRRNVDELAGGGECTALVQIGVVADDFMAGFDQHRHHDGADITLMTCDENAHDVPP